MPALSPVDQKQLSQQFTDAVAADDVPLANRLLEQFGAAIPEDLLPVAAALEMDQENWTAAGRLLSRVRDRDMNCEVARRLCRNLAKLQACRSEVYERLVETRREQLKGVIPNHYNLVVGSDQNLTLIYQPPGVAPMYMSPDNAPFAALRNAIKSLHASDDYRRGRPVAICGIGDGYLLNGVSRGQAELDLDQEQLVYLIESDPAAVLACLSVHDLTGRNGPIESERVQWFVGADWVDQLGALFNEDAFYSPPEIFIKLGRTGGQIKDRVDLFNAELLQSNQAIASRIAEYYNGMAADDIATVLAGDARRAPRALVVSGRFTTVLQYAASDLATGLEKCDWDVQIAREPSNYQRLTLCAMHRILDEFRPDVVFLIDHLRYTAPGMFPDGLPVVTWIQDNLPQLCNSQAGRGLKKRDFIVGAWVQRFVLSYDYPARQSITIPRLISVSDQSDESEASAAVTSDLVYVSNHSATVEDRVRQVLKQASHVGVPQDELYVVEACCDQIVQLYRAGSGRLRSAFHIAESIITPAESQYDYDFGEVRVPLAYVLWDYLNSLLCRHQSLQWVADTADQHGLSLGLYGRDWDKHPDFGRFAKGYVKYGAELEGLTRRTHINLALEPFGWRAHQRLLDGIAAGGFYLFRYRREDVYIARVWDLFDEHLDDESKSLEEAIERFPEEHRTELRNLTNVIVDGNWSKRTDLVWEYRKSVEEDRQFMYRLIPHHNEVAYTDQDDMERKIIHFMNHPEDRERIMKNQRAFVVEHFSYEAGVRRIASEMSRIIGSERV